MRLLRGLAVLIMMCASVMVTASVAPHASATFLGRNGLIAFERDGNIFTIRPDGTHLRQLTRTHGDTHPAWSPDGRKLAFSRDGDLYVMSPTGARFQRLTTDPGEETEPAWSPDGEQLAFSFRSEDGDYGIARTTLADPDTVEWLVNSGPECIGAATPAWSQRGDVIVYVNYDCFSDYQGLRYIDVETGRTVLESTFCWYGCRSVDVSPDGTSVAYDPEFNDYMVFTAPFGTWGGDELTNDEHWEAADPVWSPDGRLIAFSGEWYHNGTSGPQGIYVMRARDGQGKRLVVRDANTPSWQPAS